MSDAELIARLRDWMEHDEGKINDAREKAADRIEALIAERDEWMKDSAAAWDKCEARRIDEEVLEAKLEKAVEGLKRICMQPDYRLPSPQEIARTTLAEIKGESHE